MPRCSRFAHATSRTLCSAVALLLSASVVPAKVIADTPSREPTAAQIVERNVAARGGLEAWRKVDTMVWAGRLESAHAPIPRMGFTLEQKRPNKTRFEISAMNQKTWRVFDGTQGWKETQNREGRPDVQPYTSQELKFAQQAQGIDGALIDYQARGSTVVLEGPDTVEGHPAYRLLVRQASGERHHVWIDAKTYLDLRYDRLSYTPAGLPVPVNVVYRDYKTFDGLQIPTVIETGAGARALPPDRMLIETVSINPPLDDRLFARPGANRMARRALIGSGSGSASGAAPALPAVP